MDIWGTQMIKHKYGEFADRQISETKAFIRKRIFFLLLVAEDLENQTKFPGVNLEEAHTGVMWRISGLNDLLGQPQEIVNVLSLLEEAKNEIKEEFNFPKYRKLILDAGAEVSKIKESEV